MTVETYVSIPLPPPAARDAMIAILDAIGKHQSPFDQVALSVGLSDLHIPIEGTLSVPIDAEIETRPLRWEASIEIEAQNNEHLFPKFEGTLSVTPDGHDTCELWLQGTYMPPLGALGAGIDATVLQGAAQSALRRFVDWLAMQIRERVEKDERDHARRTLR
jgi:hypothetical protein